MTDLQAEKALVLRFYEDLDTATDDSLIHVGREYTSANYFWRGVHPFHEQNSMGAVVNLFWKPFRQSFRKVQRRSDVFMAGRNEVDDCNSAWVCSMGHLMGLFDEDWLGIPANHKMAFLRYAEFNRIEADKIAETAFFCDILSVMQQVGLKPLPPQTGASLITPGPMTHDGLLYGVQDPQESRATLDLINRMRGDMNSENRSGIFEAMQAELGRTWHPDMIWWGPAGIGATYTIDRYIRQHSGPFRTQLADRRRIGHVARFAEGHYGGFFGWPSLAITPIGGYLGLPASNKSADMRVVDIYRREGNKLAENWIFIDMLHFLNMLGLDLLTRIKAFPRT